jgi:dTDP-6-deoxy-L-talose 4-dehydrogenase (NAD+)
MRVLVTGATGFIGKHLCTDLVSSGHEVLALCRNPDISLKGVKTLKYSFGTNFSDEVFNFLPEVLVHLAWDGIPDFSRGKCLFNLTSQLEFFEQILNLNLIQKIIVKNTALQIVKLRD